MTENINFSSTYSKKGLLKIIDSLPLAIAVIDEKIHITLANRATLMFVNKVEEELIGQVGGDAFECLHTGDAEQGCGFGAECLKCKLRSTIQDTLKTQNEHHLVEITMALKVHGKRHLRISTLPITLNHKNSVLLAIEDITMAKEHEKTLMEKEKLSAVIQTAGAVCHEMNQPLMIIQGHAELLLETLSKKDANFENIQTIIKNVERLGNITGQLMKITQYKTKKYLNGEIIDLDASSQ